MPENLKRVLFYLIPVLFSALHLHAQDPILERGMRHLLQSLGVTDSLRVDPDAGLVMRLRYKGGALVETLWIRPLTEYQEMRFWEATRRAYAKAVTESLAVQRRETRGQGLIPDIEIPVSFPRGLGFLGEGGRLSIEGLQDITIGGVSNIPIEEIPSEYGRPSLFPQLELDQRLQVRLTGTVGQKIHVDIDHDSQRESDLQNRISLRYTGEEDEILQSIEAGDVSLSLPGASYAGFSAGSRKGLFGLKAQGNFGPLQFTMIASKEQGESRQGHFTMRGRSAVDTLYDNAFVRWRYFFISDGQPISVLYVYRDDGNARNNQETGAQPGVAYFDPNNPDPTLPMVPGDFDLLREGEDYSIDRESGLLVLRYSLQDAQILGVVYQTADGTQVGEVGDTLRLKLIRPPLVDFPDSIPAHPQTPQDSAWYQLWNYELKNVYQLGTRNIPPDQLTLRIYRDDPGNDDQDGENGVTYLQLLGLDADGDGFIETQGTDPQGRTFDIYVPQTGVLIFPDPHPFASPALSQPDSVIYFRKRIRQNQGKKYYIVVQYTQPMSTIFLGATDILEGSEEVLYNGQRLQRGVDYQINYETGTVTILNDQVRNDPQAEIEINYQYAPIFSARQKTLLGTRLDYTWGEALRIGGSWLFRSEGAFERRPRLGEEPLRNMLAGLDMDLNLELAPVTRFLDRLPLIETSDPTTLTLKGEVARIFPNPNTAGAGYIDDMEDVRNRGTLPISRTSWIFGSIPTGRDTGGLARRIIWANPLRMFRRGDIFPNLPPRDSLSSQTVLMVILEPRHPGDTTNWASLNTLLNKDGSDYTTMDFLELIVKGDGLKLHIDVGKQIPEDAVWRAADGSIRGYHPDRPPWEVVDNEDRNGDNQLDRTANNFEDTGLDRVEGDDEAGVPGDDGNDDFAYTPGSEDYSRINGTEGNLHLDSEDLNGDNRLTYQDEYIEITIDLDDTTRIRPYLVTPTGWKHYRIPVREEFARMVVSPELGTGSFTDILSGVVFGRIWFSGFTRTDTVFIARMEFTGNSWLNRGIATQDTTEADSTEHFLVTAVNNKEHVYEPPPGVIIERDLTTGEPLKEQSLALNFRLLPGHEGRAQRALGGRSHDLLDYQELRFFVRPAIGASPPYPTVILRLGKNEHNYYEYRYKVTSADWAEVVIPLDSLTQFKKRVLDTLTGSPSDTTFLHGRYGFRGQPALNDISLYEVAVLNDEEAPIEGEVWIDELRATAPRTQGGLAMKMDLNLQLAGLGNLRLNLSREEANFHKLTESRRNRKQSERYNLNLSLNLDRLFPQSWGFRIPFNYQAQGDLQLPLYQTGKDVLLTPEQRLAERTVQRSRRLSFSFQKQGSRNFLGRVLLDPLRINLSRQGSFRLSPTLRDTTENTRLTLSYSYSPRVSKPLRLLFLDLTYLPSNIQFQSTYNRQFSDQESFVSGTRTTRDRNLGDLQGSISWSPFRNSSIQYTQRRSYDFALTPLNLQARQPGWELGREENLNLSYNLGFFGLLNTDLSYTANYQEDHNPLNRPEEYRDTRDFTRTRTYRITLGFPIFQKLFRWIERLGQWRGAPEDEPPHMALIRFLGRLGQSLGVPSLSYSRSDQIAQYLLYERPRSAFRLGFNDRFPQPGLDERRNSLSVTDNYSTSGRLNLLSLLSVSYNLSLEKTRSQTLSRDYLTTRLTLPSLNFNLSVPQTRLGPLRNWIQNLSLRSGIERQRQENGFYKGDLEGRTENLSFSPLLSVNATLRGGINLDLNYTRSTARDERFFPGGGSNITHNTEKTLSLRLSYSFRNRQGIPFPFVGRLRSEIQLTLDGRQSERISQVADSPYPLTHQQTSSLSLTARTNLSSDVTGSMNIRYQSTVDKKAGRGNRSLSIQARVTFRF